MPTAKQTPSIRDVVAIIPARYASSRFPGKPLALIRGVPLIVRVWEQVATALPADRIVVATDDARIADRCRAEGMRVVTTPAACLTGTDRLWAACRALDDDAAIVVNVQGDEPLVQAEDIWTVIRAAREWPDHVVNAMCRIDAEDEIASPHVPKVAANEAGRLLYMSRAPIPFRKDSAMPPTYYRQVCIYGFRRAHLQAFGEFGRKGRLEAAEDIEILRFAELDIPVRMVEVGGGSIAVDVPEDIVRVEQRLATV